MSRNCTKDVPSSLITACIMNTSVTLRKINDTIQPVAKVVTAMNYGTQYR